MLEELCHHAGLVPERVSYCSGLLSQKITSLERGLAKLHPVIGWVATLPLRVAPVWCDGILSRITGWPSYSICLEAYKPRSERVAQAAELRDGTQPGRSHAGHSAVTRLRDGTTGR
jgi:hypothetical protein